MNKLSREKQTQVIAALVEGNSINSTVRMTGVAKMTVLSLLMRAGTVCAQYQGEMFRNLPCKRVQVDEIWSFVHSKQKNVPKDKRGQFGYGDVYTWTAICADTKLIPSWLIGTRDYVSARAFIADLAGRLANRVQLTSDGHKAYLDAVERAFGSDVDYTQLIKLYGMPNPNEVRYSAGECCGVKVEKVTGNPDPSHISTSFVERQNLTMRMCMRRFTRLTNGFSKKVDNLAHSVALYFMYYNFCRIHSTLRATPAMKAGVSSKVWSIEDIVDLVNGN